MCVMLTPVEFVPVSQLVWDGYVGGHRARKTGAIYRMFFECIRCILWSMDSTAFAMTMTTVSHFDPSLG